MPRSMRRRAIAAGAMCLTATTIAAATAAGQASGPTVVSKRLEIRVGGRAGVAGHAAPGAGAALQVRRHGRWATLARSQADATGRFALNARVHRPMSVPARVRIGGTTQQPLGRLNVYRVAIASWYGPGLYGNRTGCGGRLRPGQLGVANKVLPCGTMVTFRHRGRVVRVPVIDRGPYVAGREFDLTAATAQRLAFHGHGPILVAR